MKTVKVSDLSGPALDWAVAKCEWVPWTFECADASDFAHARYSSDWSLAGPIIERESLSVMPAAGEGWRAYKTHRIDWASQCYSNGPTPTTAAMRCYVASRLGDTVEIPEELV